ncbi:MAG: methionine--tRNA ligase [Candidatus Gracilibacteria bacterium]|nr:methionine--tRNA ligase [Candidatus Gracilibacteria bacterium]
MEKFYISTAIAYVNAPPHIGFALEVIFADVLARYHRLKGDETFYLTGVDEHGVKLYEAAKNAGLTSQEFVDRNAEKFQALKGILNLSNDDFIRTTSERHKKGAQKIWTTMFEKGDIYKGSYKGNYCVGCEAFIADKDLDENGFCPNHKKKPELLEEENYFFKLSKYSDQIKKAIESDEMKIVPESRKKEFLNLIGEGGLNDVSFSRPKTVLPWGIDVPNDDSQVMYVWCDALTNYISALGYGSDDMGAFAKFWPCDSHIIGKDILRFHAGIWIGMLLSAEIALPKSILVHGFITSEGQKMSKSLGNVVDPLIYVDKYGADSLRYFLTREIPTFDDGDFSHKRFVEVYNSELANGLGNLVNRVVMMTERYVDGKVPALTSAEGVHDKLIGLMKRYEAAMENFDLKTACETAYEVVDFGNKYIDDMKPWVMAKDEANKEMLANVLYNLLEVLRIIAIMIAPYVPQTSEKIFEQIGMKMGEVKWSCDWGILKEGGIVKKADVLFQRLEE